MRIGNIDITPQIDNTFTISIDGHRQLNRVPEGMAIEFIQFGHSLGHIKERDRDAAIKYFEKPQPQNLEAMLNSQLMSLIVTLNMVHESIDPDDIDDDAEYRGQYLKAAEVLAKLSSIVEATATMCRHLHTEEGGDVEKDEPKPEPKPVCMCKKGDPYCGTPGCDGLIGKKKSSGFSLRG